MTESTLTGAVAPDTAPTNATLTETGELAISPEQRRTALLARAELLGLSFKANITTDKLQALIMAKMDEPIAAPTAPEPMVSEREKQRREAMKLRRVIIQANDPHKQQHESEQITVGNRFIGTVTRVFPFNTEWHIEQCIYDTLKERKFQMFIPKNKGKLLGVPESKLTPAYTIIDMPDLTEQELKELAAQQAANHSIDK